MPKSGKSFAARFQALDMLATMVAVVSAEGVVLFANAALETAVGLSKRSIEGTVLRNLCSNPNALQRALSGIRSGRFAALHYGCHLTRHGGDLIAVHVIAAQTEQPGEFIVEMLPLEPQARQAREERQADHTRTNRELFLNLAHEIKNPLGGIRGAAQLLEMELDGAEQREYTEVIIREADRLRRLVDRLLEPHRHTQVMGQVNIHDVCERVRALVLTEFPRGLKVVRDYDVSIPEFRGDREQLIQAVLNIAHNAVQALAGRIAQGDAEIMLRTRVLRQVSINKQRHRLALQLHIIDNGPGVPESMKKRVFFPLVSGRDGGTGLGLTLAQTFVQQHQGAIELDSRPGCTDFSILIPIDLAT
ncbi:MAG: nitrogen regulation protein NR(II) [Desulfovibrionaceae bacterium]|nr:nitrogen regulation protein NR(II) [Desulfovibrionaceae bacterium]